MNRREKEARKKRKRRGISRPSGDAAVRHATTTAHVWSCSDRFLEQGGLVYAAACETCKRSESVLVDYGELRAITAGEMPAVDRGDDERWERRDGTYALHVMFEDHAGFVALLEKADAERILSDASAKGWGADQEGSAAT